MTKKKAPITNGSPKKAKKKVAIAKKITQGVLVSHDLFESLLLCYAELLAIHRQYGDYDNAIAHSRALNNVQVYGTHDIIKDMRNLDINCNELSRNISKKQPASIDKEQAAELLLTDANKRDRDGNSRSNSRSKFDIFDMLTPEETFNRLKKLYIEHLGLDDPANEGKENPNKPITMKSLINGLALGADSLDSVELAMALEEEFDIEISDEFVEYVADATFEQLIEVLRWAYVLDI